MANLKHITIGLGEVGSAIQKIVGGMYFTRTKNNWDGKDVDVIHICIPYKNDKEFKDAVKLWQKFAKLIIVHSTVPVGTCDALGVVHSFITGKHPDLESGIRTFVKYFGGEKAQEAADVFEKLGIKTKVFKEARTTEAMKLISTTYYGLNIMIEKEIHIWCKENNLPFEEVYSENNRSYNKGYLELGNAEFVRPNLKHIEGGVGGHCIIQNLDLIKDFWLGELLKKQNEKYKKK